MAITVNISGSLKVSGLSAGANTIPHGLSGTPAVTGLRPNLEDRLGHKPGQDWTLTQAADATNIYVTVGNGNVTSGTIDFTL